MKKILIAIPVLIIIISCGFYFYKDNIKKEILSPLGKSLMEQIEKPLDKYSFKVLKDTRFSASDIIIDRKLREGEGFTSYVFHYYSFGKKVSGLLNLLDKPGIYPVIVMLRGYIDQEIYETGIGTQHAGEVFSQNGFITLAPDFLGYGESDKPSGDPMEERFQTYTTALTLFSSIGNLNKSLDASTSGGIASDINKVGIWGHSNGGHIALSVLEITGKNYPAVLWAPVSKPFPYSILYYTDESDDHGKKLRKVVADFEKDYDAETYSPTNYFDWINAPIQVHQGGADEEVQQKWSDQMVEQLKKLDKKVEYFTYPEQDHNFSAPSWSTIVSRNISFYKEQFGLQNP